MAFDFPASPAVNQIFVAGAISYIWTGTVWNVYAVGPDAQPGRIGWFAFTTAPAGWLKANGALISRTTYVNLFAAIDVTFGVGDGINTFALPDLRGEFVRAWDDARGIDAGRNLGTAQADALKATTTSQNDTDHTHYVSIVSGNENSNHTHTASDGGTLLLNSASGGGRQFSAGPGYPGIGLSGVSAFHTHNINGASGTMSAYHAHSFGSGPETRPRNVALLACVKY